MNVTTPRFSALFLHSSYTSQDTDYYVHPDQVNIDVDTPSMGEKGRPIGWDIYSRKGIPYEKDGVYFWSHDWNAPNGGYIGLVGRHPLVAEITDELEDVYLAEAMVEGLHITDTGEGKLPIVNMVSSKKSTKHRISEELKAKLAKVLTDVLMSQKPELMDNPWRRSICNRLFERIEDLHNAKMASFGNRVWTLDRQRMNERN
jgi:hypothetical protein